MATPSARARAIILGTAVGRTLSQRSLFDATVRLDAAAAIEREPSDDASFVQPGDFFILVLTMDNETVFKVYIQQF